MAGRAPAPGGPPARELGDRPGAKWLTQDRCASTLTRVVSGAVTVRDFIRYKTAVVRAGKRYTASLKR